MTNFTTRMMIAAATLVVAAGAASAQTMKAEIPFTFRANGAVMAAGTYRVTLSQTSGVPVLYFFNHEAKRAAIALAQSRNDPPKAWQAAGNPMLSFRCGAKVCSLAGVWSGSGSPAYSFAAPKLDKNESTHVALVVLRTSNSD